MPSASDLPTDIARCTGKTGVVLGESVLCAVCTDCRRFTSSRVGENLSFIAPPQFSRLWPGFMETCPMHIGPYDYEMEVV